MLLAPVGQEGDRPRVRSTPREPVAPGSAVRFQGAAQGLAQRADLARFDRGNRSVTGRQTEPQDRAGPGNELRRRPGRNDPAAVDHHDPVREALHVGQLVRRQEDRAAERPQVAEERAHGGLRGGIHAGCRLVQDQELGTSDQGERQRQPLLLTPREELVAPVCRVAEPQQVQQLVGIGGIGVEAGVEPDQLARPALRGDPAVLEHQADPRVERGPVPGRVHPQDAHVAGVPAPIALQDLHRGGLAGAVRSQQGHELAAGDREVEVIEHLQRPVALAKAANVDGERHVPAGARGPARLRRGFARGGHGAPGGDHFRISARIPSSSVPSWTCPIWRSRMIPARSMK